MIMHQQAFIEEASELLDELEKSLLEVENSSDKTELISRIFRAMHTIKGSGSMFGFDELVEFMHDLETIFDLVREGQVVVTKELIDLSLSSCDVVRKMLDSSQNSKIIIDEDKKTKITMSLQKFLPSTKEEEKIHEFPLKPMQPENDLTYKIHFRPFTSIFVSGTNPIFLLDELRTLGECKINARIDKIPVLKNLDPEACYIYWDISLKTKKDINTIKDVFIFVEDDCELKIETEANNNIQLDENKNLPPIDPKIEFDSQQKEPLTVNKITKNEDPASSENDKKENKPDSPISRNGNNNSKENQNKHTATIRVPAEKLDSLVDLVGEVVTLQARLSQYANSSSDTEIQLISEEFERHTEDLRDNAMSLRMVPINTLFSKFQRLVRDLAQDLGKEVTLTTKGVETELDKTVIEQLNNPLVHLIRNCIDHGIESPDVRTSLGKQKEGQLSLSASQSGANVLIQISDDGAGLNAEKIRARAIDKGLLSADAELPEKDIFAFICHPGFSTAQKVTNVSGRGVGMDVVKKTIDSLGGSIEIDSKKAIGTTITLKIPLTLAIIDGLLVKISQDYFVLPLSVVEECVELKQSDAIKSNGRHIANVRGTLIPYIHLREQFSLDGPSPAIEQIVITEVDADKVGFVVDQVIGEHQTVIKSLGKVYQNVEGLSGATILGDGKVALILDVPNLIRCETLKEQQYNNFQMTL